LNRFGLPESLFDPTAYRTIHRLSGYRSALWALTRFGLPESVFDPTVYRAIHRSMRERLNRLFQIVPRDVSSPLLRLKKKTEIYCYL
jgi:hypothetical protein